jgi:superfamily I DNA/RNA helicase
VKGPAGCGKSLALAARAAHLAGAGKEVLVVSFNITLLHYLRDLAVRYPHPRESVIRGITWLHFHDWCKRACQEAGLEVDYCRLFGDRLDKADEGCDAGDDLFETRIPELVERAIKEGGPNVNRYDAVLVDEGQDFNLAWWNLLRKVCREGGEMLLVADATQDLYRRACRWTDEKMKGAGFDGPWFDLQGCYRFPPTLVPHLRAFVNKYLPGSDINLPSEVEGDLFEQTVGLRWLQVEEREAVDACVRAVCDLTVASPPVPWSDITLLVSTHEHGLRCVRTLEAPPRNIKVRHVFADGHASQKRLKMAFWMGDARMKAATVHSFKGWESRAMVVHIGRAGTPAERSAVYVALSRLKRSPAGSFLTVVCSSPELEAYGRTWPVFEKRGVEAQA